MNLLFFVSSLLIILSVSLSTFFTHTLSLESERTSLTGLMKARRETRNMWQQKIYKNSTKNITADQALKDREPKALLKYTSQRQLKNKNRLNKINLSFLWDKEFPEKKRLISICETLLSNLYGNKRFLKECPIKGWQGALLKEMIKAGGKNKDITSFIDLVPSKEPLASLYYKILKGSGDYDVGLGLGYPPLSDFFFIDSKERHPINFTFASKEVLQAIFGEAIALDILLFEEKKSLLSGGRRAMSENELIEMLDRGSSKGAFLSVKDLLSFSKRSLSLEALQYRDAKSKVRYTLPLRP